MKQILETLGYNNSSEFIKKDKLEKINGYAHIFRKAIENYGLHGVYILSPPKKSKSQLKTPLVYVCEAQSEKQAHTIHQKVWNQNIVPFLMVKSPRYLRLYKGFHYDINDKNLNSSILHSVPLERLLKNIQEILTFAISSVDIEQGRIWHRWGNLIQTDLCVDKVLLEQINELGEWLTKKGLDTQSAHALIGKYVYLRYLRDRNILSDRKLMNWGIKPEHLFKRDATFEAFEEVNRKLDAWLNGSVFPISHDSVKYNEEHIKMVAGVFFGDKVSGQLHMDFQAYDFSAIPTEVLSTIYEQFLHATDPKTKKNRGAKAGAHYTPIPLVNFVIEELQNIKHLKEGMKILDPSCGSGAFLVQCYRRLIEKKRIKNGTLTPAVLKKLLVEHIFGVELYYDACQVTALSLILTLLDNVNPSDLEIKKYNGFQLPDLLNKNIFRADFFDQNSEWTKKNMLNTFDWGIGNPPWKEIKSNSKEEGDNHAWSWMSDHENKMLSTTDNQLAEAFVWKICDYVKKNGAVGLVLPAMTLTKQNSSFRQAFFHKKRVFSVVNLANLRKVLFHSKKSKKEKSVAATSPAAVVCYKNRIPKSNDTIQTYAPFLIDQITNRSTRNRKIWSFLVNSSDLQELYSGDVCDGSHLHWKIAMWGNHRDKRLMQRMKRKFESFDEFCENNGLLAHQGIELRNETAKEELEYMPSLAGKNKLDFAKLRGSGRIFEFPSEAISKISESECFVRIRGGKLGIKISSPPHVIVHAAHKFAIFSDEFLAIPPRQIGIAGTDNRLLLKALAAYLSSNFTVYHEFLEASAWGIRQDRANLASLRKLPVPKLFSDNKSMQTLALLYDKLKESIDETRPALLKELNQMIFEALGLKETEQILVEDMVNFRLQLLDGKVPQQFLKVPSQEKILLYLETFQKILDTFVGETFHHSITAYTFLQDEEAIIKISLLTGGEVSKPEVVEGDKQLESTLRKIFQKIRKQYTQWLYFDRCLKVYDGSNMYMFKPLLMTQWIRSKALSDADDVISEYISIRG